MMKPLLILAALPFAAAAYASDETLPQKQHHFSAGIAFTGVEPEVTAARHGGDGVAVDFGSLGVEDDDLNYFLEYRWRFSPKWALILATSKFDGTGVSSVRDSFEFDDTTFDVGADVQGRIEVDVYLADLLYRVYRTERSEFMIGGGIHALDMGASLQARAFVNNGDASLDRANATLLAPVPNLRFSYLYATPHWGLTMIGGWLSANVDDYSGDFFYGHLRGHYRFADNWTASLGYQYTDVDVERSRNLGTVAFDMVIKGPTLTVSWGF